MPECPACQGTGHRVCADPGCPDVHPDHPRGLNGERGFVCPRCGGTGVEPPRLTGVAFLPDGQSVGHVANVSCASWIDQERSGTIKAKAIDTQWEQTVHKALTVRDMSRAWEGFQSRSYSLYIEQDIDPNRWRPRSLCALLRQMRAIVVREFRLAAGMPVPEEQRWRLDGVTLYRKSFGFSFGPPRD